MAKIFISHSSQDDMFVDQLFSDLSLTGHTPWTDEKQIKVGQPIMKKIEEGLSQSRYCIVVLSQASVASKWVDEEWRGKYWDLMAGQKIKIMPVLKDHCEVPFFLRGFKYADFTNSYAVGFSQLSIALSLAEKMPDILKLEFIQALENTARTHHDDHIRLACVHTIWSFRPDLAKAVIEYATRDYSPINREHANMLLDNFY
jgi:hypothetical protein